MRKIATALAFFAMLGIALSSQAQLTKEQRKERKEMAKMTKNELTKKASKAARKEAKRMKKEGWQITPGTLPIDKQLDRSYNMQYELNENMAARYIMGEAMSIGENYDAAKMQAVELAKQNLAGQIQTDVAALIDNDVANGQMSQERAASIVKTVMESKNLIAQRLGRTVPVVEVYRVKENKNKEVYVRLAYDTEQVAEATVQVLREELKKKGEESEKELDCILFGMCKMQ